MHHTRVVKVGQIAIGGGHKIAIQSMTNTKTKDIKATIEQIHALERVGCDIIRVAVLDVEDAQAIRQIKDAISIPLVADIHFDYRLALIAIENGIDKLRINPGNIGSKARIAQVVDACKAHNIPIRIGVNMGSMQHDILESLGRTAEALVESAKRHVGYLEEFGFTDIVLSLKASDVATTIKAYELAAKQFNYPLHIGITEAGTKTSGSIKSAIGLGVLLHQNIGDTLRVSLAADPIEEVLVAKEILSTFNLYDKPNIIACPTCGRTEYDMLSIVNEIEAFIQSLPSIKMSIAIMGCVVNGPGEAKDADIGIAGGNNHALLFKKGKVIKKLAHHEIIPTLKTAILDHIKENS